MGTMIKHVAEILLNELVQAADLRDLLDKRQGDEVAPAQFVIPSRAGMTVKTESRAHDQKVPVALVFTWET